ncbi:MAG: DUF4833 domain-containing protein [Bacteroidales bacterium]
MTRKFHTTFYLKNFSFLLMISLNSMSGIVMAQPSETGLLFIIERSRDADEVWYSLNTDENGTVNEEKPLSVYWVRKSADNEIEALTFVQKKFGYGIQSLQKDKSIPYKWNFRIAAYKDRVFSLERTANQQYKIYTHSEGQKIEVVKMFVEFSGGSYLAPEIEKVTLTGILNENGMFISENVSR